MTVRFRHEHDLDAPSAAVRALMQDEAASEERSRRLGSLRARCVCRTEGSTRVHELHEARDTRFTTDAFETIHTTRWSAEGGAAEWTLVQTGGPGATRAEGHLWLEPISATRTRLRVEGSLAIDAGPFTKLVERLVRARLGRVRDRDVKILAEQLRERRSR